MGDDADRAAAPSIAGAEQRPCGGIGGKHTAAGGDQRRLAQSFEQDAGVGRRLRPSRARLDQPWHARQRLRADCADGVGGAGMASKFETFAALHVPRRPRHPLQYLGRRQRACGGRGGREGAGDGQPSGGRRQRLARRAAGADRLRARQCEADRRCGRAAADGRFRRRLFGRSRGRRRERRAARRRPARSAAISRTR